MVTPSERAKSLPPAVHPALPSLPPVLSPFFIPVFTFSPLSFRTSALTCPNFRFLSHRAGSSHTPLPMAYSASPRAQERRFTRVPPVLPTRNFLLRTSRCSFPPFYLKGPLSFDSFTCSPLLRSPLLTTPFCPKNTSPWFSKQYRYLMNDAVPTNSHGIPCPPPPV